jgi:RpiR family transcriptional regulator, carbohydrate utilization regulator
MNGHADSPSFDIVARIAECAPGLRGAERKVAALILDDLAGASRASIGALAERAAVSIATVTRFAKAVGCQDVRELKLRLAQAAAVGQRFLQREPGDEDTAPASLAARLFDEVRVARRTGRAGRRRTRRCLDDLRVRHGRRLDGARR